MTTNLMMKHPGPNLSDRHGEAHDKSEIVVFGFWIFLMSDLVLFGMFFATYVTTLNPMAFAGGPTPKDVFDLTSIGIQTMLLLLSSTAFGIATAAMRFFQSTKTVLLWLFVALLLGFGFIGYMLHDFQTMIQHGAGPSRSGFLSTFFAIVPLHGLHIFFGSIWIVVMMIQILTFGMIPVVKTRILRLGLFWHFLFIIWIAIFSIVYLAGVTI